eukprot:UN3815
MRASVAVAVVERAVDLVVLIRCPDALADLRRVVRGRVADVDAYLPVRPAGVEYLRVAPERHPHKRVEHVPWHRVDEVIPALAHAVGEGRVAGPRLARRCVVELAHVEGGPLVDAAPPDDVVPGYDDQVVWALAAGASRSALQHPLHVLGLVARPLLEGLYAGFE